MKNVTITLDEETAAWARVHAAERNMSLSRYVGELLRDCMRRSHEYEAAMKGWLAERPLELTGPSEPYPTREELYDRPVLRRR